MSASVLIPTLGLRDAWLAEARRSAEGQTGTPQVVVELDHSLTGQSATLNRAFARSTGAWVTVLHDDDFYVRPDAVALLEAQGRMHPEAGAVYSLPRYVTPEGLEGPTPPRLATWMAAHPRVRWADLQDGLHMHGIGVAYRREWWERVGGWDESLPACEEYEFHLRLLSRGCVFVGLPVVTVAYRLHPRQKSARRTGSMSRTSAAYLAVRKQIRARYAAVTAEVA